MSAIWRAVATWFAHVFHRRHDDWVRPWNDVTMRALYEDVRLPFEVGVTYPETPITVAAPIEPAVAEMAAAEVASEILQPTGTESATASGSVAAAPANEAEGAPAAESRRVA